MEVGNQIEKRIVGEMALSEIGKLVEKEKNGAKVAAYQTSKSHKRNIVSSYLIF